MSMETRDGTRKNTHRDTDCINAQFLQSLNVGFGEPGSPVLIENLVSRLGVCLGEVAVRVNREFLIVRVKGDYRTIRIGCSPGTGRSFGPPWRPILSEDQICQK